MVGIKLGERIPNIVCYLQFIQSLFRNQFVDTIVHTALILRLYRIRTRPSDSAPVVLPFTPSNHMAIPAGLEPALSGVTGRHFNLLNYGTEYNVSLLCLLILRLPLSHISELQGNHVTRISASGSLTYKSMLTHKSFLFYGVKAMIQNLSISLQ